MRRLILYTAMGAATAFGHTGAEVEGMDRETLRAHILEEWQAAQAAKVKPHGEVKPVQVASGASTLRIAAAAGANAANAPLAAKAFLAFPKLEVKWEGDFLWVGSNGWPDHPIMVGITNWQQQVPLPQAYFGANAWRIPLKPVPAKTPAMIEGRFLRGAIALAVNGVPIFNPQNNRGEVSAEIGELDQWGGHCGRADDYHYHAAPLHLQTVVGKGMPIAYALDGYPIYGLTEPDGSPVGKLDECHGHEAAGLGYHYHAAVKRPYVMAGFHGEVAEVEGQVDPQPRAQSVRPALEPLRGAKITGFEGNAGDGYALSYTAGGDKKVIRYRIQGDEYQFEFDDGRGDVVKQTYTARGGGEGPRGKGKGRRPEPGRERKATVTVPAPQAAKDLRDRDADGVVTAVEFAEHAKREFSATGKGGSLAEVMAKARESFGALDRNKDGKLTGDELAIAKVGFVLTSPEVEDGGSLPVAFTGDGEGATLPLEWQGAPEGTRSFAVIMDHQDPEGVVKGYWTLWDIPAGSTKLEKNAKGVGKVGTGFRGAVGYEPPQSKGPGRKEYVLHVYALSEEPKITKAAGEVNREVLLAAMEGTVLASADLTVTYQRGGATEASVAMPSADAEQRKPWMQMHGAEMDANADGAVTLAEMEADMARGQGKYDANRDGVITPGEIEAAGEVREGAAFAGLIYRHAVDLDADHDSRLTAAEMRGAVRYFFESADADKDGKLAADEVAKAPNAPLPIPAGRSIEMPTRRKEDGKGKGKGGGGGGGGQGGLVKPGLGDTMKLNVYADNWFMLYVNGRLVAVDPIQFTPHNVVSVDFLPEYPMTIAVLAKDNADPKTGMEYGSSIGDGGLVLKFGDGTVTDARWKAKSFFHGPVRGDTVRPEVKQEELPANWWAVEFDDGAWPNAKEYSVEEVDPKEPYFENDFAGAKFIWTDDLALDNTVIFRTRIEKPEGWSQRWNTKPDLDVTGAPLR